MRPRVYNKKNNNVPPGAVYVGRPSKFGNPFLVDRDGTREEVVAKFAVRLRSNKQLRKEVIKELRGKDLFCWCAPLACHADVLLTVANKEKL